MRLLEVSVYKRAEGAWHKQVFSKAFVRYFKGLAFEKNGRFKKSKMTVRIFSPSALAISLGDMIELGSGGNEPSDDALTVCEISDNLDIKNGHIRITAM